MILKQATQSNDDNSAIHKHKKEVFLLQCRFKKVSNYFLWEENIELK